ncbi:hypothetical protein [Pontibacillus sp. HMF3514]|uniref:hypothetical protein n=1 Tax=Pontibacillus sp. HMF3514 TaxID=2692425 RepID=UPI00131F9C1E|nr:hypothetical protein [Pontibacillus sp. HMF3514]QHE51282.1 hypothetical protein GS400_04205 [Pontibacillus sp. HMF3514]
MSLISPLNSSTPVDLNNPRLNWSDEQQVFKSRFAPLLTLLIQAISFGFLILVVWNLSFIAMKTTQKRYHYLS